EEMKAAFIRFAAEAQEALNATEVELRRTSDWLQERLTYWRNEVRRRQETLAQAERALAACRASGYYDPRTGAYYEPPCTIQWEAVRRARVYLAEAEAELRNVQEWTRRVQQAAGDYQRQAQRLYAWLNGELPKATALLGRSATILRAYAWLTLATSAGTVSSASSTSFSASAATTDLPTVHFESLGTGTNARYDRDRDAILLDSRYQDVREPALLAPLLAHEQVHRQHWSSEPADETSLERYLDEEMEAYRAQLRTWLSLKEEFYQRHPTPAETLTEAERDLLSDHLQLEAALADEAAFRAARAAHYRRMMTMREP
ncbi:MAG: hypothetical protein ONB06_11075, partial [candidate division KSB1 bacterium]|nr:hypothetical protein [candidate division KSB1 bacterium]